MNGLGYSPQQNIFRSHITSNSKNNFLNHIYKKHPQYNHHHALNRYYQYKANHAGISYNSVGMTRIRYEKINNNLITLSFMIHRMLIEDLDMG